MATTRIENDARFGFEFTSQFNDWIDEATFDGPCCTVDRWTYGRILITPRPNGRWAEWQTIN